MARCILLTTKADGSGALPIRAGQAPLLLPLHRHRRWRRHRLATHCLRRESIRQQVCRYHRAARRIRLLWVMPFSTGVPVAEPVPGVMGAPALVRLWARTLPRGSGYGVMAV